MNKEQEAFDKRFDTETKEIIALTQDGAGAGKAGKASLWDAHMKLLAYIDVCTDTLVQEHSSLTWQLTDEECRTNEKIYNLERERIYRLRVRESLPFTGFTGEPVRRGWNLMVLEVLERDCREGRLEELLIQYQKPVTIHPAGCGELLLDKSLGSFDGTCQWNGEECLVHLDVDEEGAETAEDALRTLEILFAQSEEWDRQARELAASELTDNANDWQDDSGEDAPEITKEDFAGRLSISELCISTDGEFEIYYNDDDMFWGHVIIVSGNLEEGLDDATMAG